MPRPGGRALTPGKWLSGLLCGDPKPEETAWDTRRHAARPSGLSGPGPVPQMGPRKQKQMLWKGPFGPFLPRSGGGRQSHQAGLPGPGSRLTCQGPTRARKCLCGRQGHLEFPNINLRKSGPLKQKWAGRQPEDFRPKRARWNSLASNVGLHRSGSANAQSRSQPRRFAADPGACLLEMGQGP